MPTRLLSRLPLLVLALAVAGCASGDSDPEGATRVDGEVQSNETTEAAEPALDGAADTTGPATVTVAGATVPTRGVVTDMESGDRACYVTLRTDDGAEQTVFADYSVCDSNAILDRRVQIEYAPDDVAAESCQGDPECLDTETVALAVVAMPIDG